MTVNCFHRTLFLAPHLDTSYPSDHFTHYRITLSALASTFGGIVRPICLAVFRLITNSNFVGCSTGRSVGLAPFKILSTYTAACRYISKPLTPYDIRPP